jgi:hypothetical protein
MFPRKGLETLGTTGLAFRFQQTAPRVKSRAARRLRLIRHESEAFAKDAIDLMTPNWAVCFVEISNNSVAVLPQVTVFRNSGIPL